MAERSKHIHFYDEEKLKNINPETMKLYKKYKMDMELRELSERTLSGYNNDLQHWFIYIYDNQGNQCITELDEDDLTEFFYYCKTEGNNSRRMKRRMSSVSAFYKFLRKKRLISENPMEYISRPTKDVDINVQTYLTEDQVTLMKQKLKEYKDNGGLNGREKELYALFSLSTMARINAVANVKWDQVDFDNRICENVLEKEGRFVTLYFSEEVKNLLMELKEYREQKNIDDCGYIFFSGWGGNKNAITTSTLTAWCKDIGEMIGIPTLHAHDFRHSGATLLKNRGMNLEDVSTLLNHLSTDVTKRFYLKIDQSKVSATKDKFEV